MTIIINSIYDARHVCCQAGFENLEIAVRVTRDQAAANREKILKVAGTLFRERGYDGIGVAEIYRQIQAWHQQYGERWAPAALLRQLAETGTPLREAKPGRPM